MGKLPEGWENYSAMGSRIPGTRIIAFKVPLKEHVVQNLPPEERFTIPILLEKVSNLGLIVDLTMTVKYYSHNEVVKKGVSYAKIRCPGQQLPNDSLVYRFFDIVDTYLEDHKNDNTLIGVHCTHGVNRTGYLICRYLMQRLGYSSNDALKLVEHARGHGIERIPYIKHLHSLTPGRHSYLFRRSKDIIQPWLPIRGGDVDWRENKETVGKGKESLNFHRGKMGVRGGDDIVKEKGRGRERDRPSTSQNISVAQEYQDSWGPPSDNFLPGRKQTRTESGMDDNFYGRGSEKRRMDFLVESGRVKEDDSRFAKHHERYASTSYYHNTMEKKTFSEYNDPTSTKPYYKIPTYGPNPNFGKLDEIELDRPHQFSAKDHSSFRQSGKRHPDTGYTRNKKSEEYNFSGRQDSDFRGKFDANFSRGSWDDREAHGSRSSHYGYKEREILPKDRVTIDVTERKLLGEELNEHDRHWVSNKYSKAMDNRRLMMPSFDRYDGKPRPEQGGKRDTSWEREDKIMPREARDYGQREERFVDEHSYGPVYKRRNIGRRFSEEDRNRDPVYVAEHPNHYDRPPFSDGDYSRNERYDDYDHRSGRGERIGGQARESPFTADKFKGHSSYHGSINYLDKDVHPRDAHKIDAYGYSPDLARQPHHPGIQPAPYSGVRSNRSDSLEHHRPSVVREQERLRGLDQEYGNFDFPTGIQAEVYPPVVVDRGINKTPSVCRSLSPLPRANPARISRDKSPEDLREEIRRTRARPSTGEIHHWERGRRDSRTPSRHHRALVSAEALDCRELINQKRSINYDERDEADAMDEKWGRPPHWDGPPRDVQKVSDKLPFSKQRLDMPHENLGRKPIQRNKVFNRLDRSRRPWRR
ncbi:uncharacterized protein LOC106661669 isoform X1 [Cimex lectularius]|uniref:RNA/RNP complex-1-interacting phosphatase n=1 Tax=Cimex lectularius TaxID=79782 RepID=A0A8I6RBB4_CIMLE|nr:uncharacterized protein LOC106661669 isoform X1 [Cimex lectularius]